MFTTFMYQSIFIEMINRIENRCENHEFEFSNQTKVFSFETNATLYFACKCKGEEHDMQNWNSSAP